MWVKDIRKLANLTNRSFPESAAEEIHFWSSIGEALEMTNTELRSEQLWKWSWTCSCRHRKMEISASILKLPTL